MSDGSSIDAKGRALKKDEIIPMVVMVKKIGSEYHYNGKIYKDKESCEIAVDQDFAAVDSNSQVIIIVKNIVNVSGKMSGNLFENTTEKVKQ
jgi:hypothetical protein